MENLNKYFTKREMGMVEKFNQDLIAFAKETGEDVAILYEDANTSFTLKDVRLENGNLKYIYDGYEESEPMIVDYVMGEPEPMNESLSEWIKFWRFCLRRAKRYWAMETERLDKIQDGEIKDEEE